LRLFDLWKKAKPVDNAAKNVIEQIMALEICNWNLEEGFLALCDAIGANKPSDLAIGHLRSVSEERWKKLWAYYLTLRNWLPTQGCSGYRVLLKLCDSNDEIQNHILPRLGDPSKLKELYVERLCVCLERWLGGYLADRTAQMKAHNAAAIALEKEIHERDPEGQVVHKLALQSDGDGRLQPCNHKAFRRYVLIISSIGAGRWRASMPRRGTDGLERAATLEKYLSPLKAWIDGTAPKGRKSDALSVKIFAALGPPDNTKLFLASLLHSLLRSQQLAAQKLGAHRKEES
jgi:hypothetical protein